MCQHEELSVGAALDLWDRGEQRQVFLAIDAAARSFERDPDAHGSVASEITARSLADNAAALRRADPDAPLGAWLRNVRKNVLLERARLDKGVRPLPPREPATRVEAVGAGSEGWEALDMKCLTDAQREAFELRLEGLTQARIAKRLGLSRAAVRDRLFRAVRRLRNAEARSVASRERDWALTLLLSDRIPRCSLTVAQSRGLLRRYLQGESRKSLAEFLGASPEAVRKRLQRWKRIARDTDP